MGFGVWGFADGSFGVWCEGFMRSNVRAFFEHDCKIVVNASALGEDEHVAVVGVLYVRFEARSHDLAVVAWLWVVGCGLWVVGCGLWVVGWGLWVVGCGLWVVGYQL